MLTLVCVNAWIVTHVDIQQGPVSQGLTLDPFSFKFISLILQYIFVC